MDQPLHYWPFSNTFLICEQTWKTCSRQKNYSKTPALRLAAIFESLIYSYCQVVWYCFLFVYCLILFLFIWMNNIFFKTWNHCVKRVQIRSFFWSVFSRIRTEYGPEKKSAFGHFSRSGYNKKYICPCFVRVTRESWIRASNDVNWKEMKSFSLLCSVPTRR